MNIYAKIQSNDCLNEAMLKRLKAELRIMKATTVAQVSAVPPPGKALAQLDGAITAVKKTERTVKAVKWICAVFHLETAAVQSVPTQIGRGDFTAFALILRMDMGGRGDKNPNPNLNRSPSPSQSVAVSLGLREKSDTGKERHGKKKQL
jgi:hypothetical protein